MNRFSENTFRLAFQGIPNALALVDSRGRIQAINSAFRNLTGHTLDSLKDFNVLKSCREQLRSDAAHDSLLDWQGPMTWPVPLPDEGTQLFYVSLTSLRDACISEGEIELSYLLCVRSVLGGLGEAKVETDTPREKLESLGVLAGSIAHDLNNLLTGILGHVSYLRLAGSPELARSDSLLAIEDGVRKAAAMTQQVLEYARGMSPRLEAVNFSLVVGAAVNLFRASIPAGIELVIESEKDDIYVLGEESKLSQLVMNLEVNARDALPHGGRIDIRLHRVRLSQPTARAGFQLSPGEYARLTIEDNGHGIPQDLQERIFEPFFTTKRDRGTGLGLATVFSIVEQICGSVSVQSEIGRGTVFEVLIPIVDPAHSTCETVASRSTQQQVVVGGSESILVVDDEEAVRMIIQRSLEHLGYSVAIAERGDEAVRLYRERGGFDLVIVDMIMPQMPGDEVFFSLRRIDPRAAVLIASGYSSDARTKAVLDAGGLGFIQKPFAVEELAHEVRRCLDLAGAA